MSFFKVVKKTTGLTGLKVANNPQHVLGVIYGKILRTLNNIPQDSAYRKYTEEIITHRASIVENAKCTEEIEEKINCGQVEEIIIQAENELSLSRNFVKWKPWEKPTIPLPPNQWTWPPAK